MWSIILILLITYWTQFPRALNILIDHVIDIYLSLLLYILSNNLLWLWLPILFYCLAIRITALLKWIKHLACIMHVYGTRLSTYDVVLISAQTTTVPMYIQWYLIPVSLFDGRGLLSHKLTVNVILKNKNNITGNLYTLRAYGLLIHEKHCNCKMIGCCHRHCVILTILITTIMLFSLKPILWHIL